MPPLFALRNLKRDFDGRTVLDIDDLEIENGQIYMLTGANGAGKSTLLLILAFLLRPSQGEIDFHGQPVDWSHGLLHHLRREVTLVHQAPYLFDTSVFENVALGLRFRATRGEQIRRRVREALETVGLAGFEARNARRLSGGETQRVAIARALAPAPRVLLLDETFANVDAATTVILEEVIRSLPALGTTVILTTHDPGHARCLTDKRIHLRVGRPDAGPPEIPPSRG